jgi:DNA mismatch endonuclease (patch repair protein)
MQRTRARDNPFEVSIRSQLYRKGFRYRIHYPVPGMKRITCDIALPALKIAIFLDGCFWHGCGIHQPSVKKNNAFWLEKIARNQARDIRVREHLEAIGWTTLRFWEHEPVEAIVDKIASTARNLRAIATLSRRRTGTLQNKERTAQ